MVNPYAKMFVKFKELINFINVLVWESIIIGEILACPSIIYPALLIYLYLSNDMKTTATLNHVLFLLSNDKSKKKLKNGTEKISLKKYIRIFYSPESFAFYPACPPQNNRSLLCPSRTFRNRPRECICDRRKA
ncbi:hypothetical protein CEXT_219981 [Caerostris extrusa]|uniref:Uncharacterized protein n=1 Tax=Caerostris extrusa TaxID=172846 RepID=A0AAV4MDA8_CAEEX|nr:hypothetical protein CEXT_219981 [Caerostris extrusa]